MKKYLLFLAICLVMQTFPSKSMSGTIQKTGIFSNMRYHEESGDLLGIEIFIFVADEGYYALFQESEGGPGKPYLVPIVISNETFNLTLPVSSLNISTLVYNCKIEAHRLVLKYQIGKEKREIILKRKASYWQ